MTAETTGRTRPFTGAEYLESLRDGREIWIYGERVKDVTTHPAFRNTARMIARLYDALHDPAPQGRAHHRRPTPAAAASRTSSIKAPRNAEELVGARDAIAEWARVIVRLDRPQPRLQGGVPRHARRQLRLLRAVRRERAALVQAGRRRRSPSSTTPSSIRRSIATSRSTRSKTCTCTSRRRPTTGLDRQRRQGRGDDVEPDALQLHRQQRRAADQDQAVRLRLHRADRRAGREAALPPVVRDDGGGDGHAVRLSALEPDGRERLDPDLRQGARAVGERVRLRRHREGQQLLPAVRASCRASCSRAARAWP